MQLIGYDGVLWLRVKGHRVTHFNSNKSLQSGPLVHEPDILNSIIGFN